jgi:hypothetical protein
VANGVESEDRNIADLAAICPHSCLLLGGFSQGAQVTRGALARLTPGAVARVVAVLLFGDPYFSSPDPSVEFPQAASDPEHFLPDRRGVLLQRPFARTEAVTPVLRGRVFSWCHREDIVRQGARILSRTGKTAHRDYGTDLDDMASAVASVGSRLNAIGFVPTAYRYRVTGTCEAGGCGLADWSGPRTTAFAPIAAANENQVVPIICQTAGQSITGANGISSSIWDELSDGAFVSDYYIDTPNEGIFSRPIPLAAIVTGE